MAATTEAIPSLADFRGMLDQTFRSRYADEGEFDSDLVEVKVITADEKQENFSLLFRGPVDAPAKQGIYELSTLDNDSFSLFLVPVSKDEKGIYFEAVFNNFVKT